MVLQNKRTVFELEWAPGVTWEELLRENEREFSAYNFEAASTDLLARHFVGMLNERFGASKQISDAAMETLRRHTWPGNVRELLHAVESAMVVCGVVFIWQLLQVLPVRCENTEPCHSENVRSMDACMGVTMSWQLPHRVAESAA